MVEPTHSACVNIERCKDAIADAQTKYRSVGNRYDFLIKVGCASCPFHQDVFERELLSRQKKQIDDMLASGKPLTPRGQAQIAAVNKLLCLPEKRKIPGRNSAPTLRIPPRSSAREPKLIIQNKRGALKLPPTVALPTLAPRLELPPTVDLPTLTSRLELPPTVDLPTLAPRLELTPTLTPTLTTTVCTGKCREIITEQCMQFIASRSTDTVGILIATLYEKVCPFHRQLLITLNLRCLKPSDACRRIIANT